VERRALFEKAPFFAVSLLFGLIALDVEHGGNFHGLFGILDKELKATLDVANFTPYQRVMFPTFGFLKYFWQVFVPVHLGAFYPYPTPAEASHPKYLFSIFFFLGAIALAVWSIGRNRAIAFGLGWYILVVLPVLQWVPVGGSALADRMTYLAYFGLFFLLALGADALVARYRSMRFVVVAGIAVATSLLFVRTTQQVATWKDTEALWSNVVRNYPRCDVPYISRGNGRGEAGQIQGAMADLQTAMRLGSRRADMYEGLGNVYASIGKADSAVIMFGRALTGNPNTGRTYYNRAIAYLILTRPREALSDLDKALELMPLQAPSLHFPRGNAYLQLGMYPQAIAEYSRAIEAEQLVTDALINRGTCKLHTNDPTGAEADFRETLRLDPGNSIAAQQLRAMGKR
jgi:tetratricopeptide (TPR) repeat protein